jgi:hypothetical protein
MMARMSWSTSFFLASLSAIWSTCGRMAKRLTVVFLLFDPPP